MGRAVGGEREGEGCGGEARERAPDASTTQKGRGGGEREEGWRRGGGGTAVDAVGREGEMHKMLVGQI